jgi:hypothetical protein
MKYKKKRHFRLFSSALMILGLLLTTASTGLAQGATTPFKTYEAEAGTLDGGATIRALGAALPSAPSPELEASGQKFVELNATDESVTWTTTDTVNTVVVRASIPDAPGGGGTNATLDLYVDGVFRQALDLTSKYSWVYGVSAFTDNNPATGTPKKFYDQSRAFIVGNAVAPGSTFTLKKGASNTATFYHIDLIQLENVGPALSQPANTLSITSYGATPNDGTDDTVAIKACVSACQSQGKGMWIPPGTFHNSVRIGASNISIYGAGMWYSTIQRLIIGSTHAWDLKNCNIQDLFIDNPETGRALAQGHDYGVLERGALGWTIQRVWVHRGGAAFWCSGTNGTIKDCRATESWADGINLNNGPIVDADKLGINITAQNNYIIGSGDDGIAINAQNGGDVAGNMVNTKVLNNTSIGAYWANGIRIAGGRNSLIQDNLVTDANDSNGIRVGKFGGAGNPCESVLVVNNLILRSGGLRPNFGNSGIAVTDTATATINSNVIIDSHTHGIQVENCTATFTGNIINHPVAKGVFIKSGAVGSGTFTTNSVSNLNSGQLAFQNNSASFTATSTGDNSWEILSLLSASPASVAAGSADFLVTLTGTGFLPPIAGNAATGSFVQWNGTVRSTTFVSSTTLRAVVTAADVAGPNLAIGIVTVQNPNNAISNSKTVTIVPATVAAAQSDVAAVNAAATVTTAPGDAGGAGVTATLQNNSTGTGEAVIMVANYPGNPTPEPSIVDVGAGYVGVQTLNVDSTDTAAVRFYYPSTVTDDNEAKLNLRYYNGTFWVPVLSSGGVTPQKETVDNLDGTVSGGRFSVVFDNTSTPKITELGETVFTFAIPPTPPSITTQPVTQTVTVGDNVILTLTATGTAPLSYQWYKGGTAITDNASATTDTLTLNVVITADAGDYDCVVTNLAGSAESDVASLTVNKAAATVLINGLAATYDGAPKSVTAVTIPAGLVVMFTYDGSTTAPTAPGTYAVVGTIDDPNYSGSATGTLVISTAVLVRHAPTINAGLDGSLQVLLPESITLNGNGWISGDLLVPGTPSMRLNGHPIYGGTIDGTGSATPSNYMITLNGNAVLRHLVRRTNAVAMPPVSAPPSPTGSRTVSLNSVSDSPGDFATIRNLTLNGNAGIRTVPAGTYGMLTVNGNAGLIVGNAGATTPAVYNLQSLTLNGNSALQVVGPVVINLANGVSVNGSLGDSDHPEWLKINIASGGLTLNGNVTVSGSVTAPSGMVTINGHSVIKGGVNADQLTLNGNGLLDTIP